jgi:glycosyltransferase involved in cell wall biosynthesis
VQIVGVSLVRNEDRFVRQALSNAAGFCDRILVADHLSSDRTPEILAELARAHDHVEVRRIRHSAESHELVEPFVGTDTWILSVDGDELYDPEGLAVLREELASGSYDGVFRLRPAGLHCDELDEERGLASGYLSPPSRPLVGLLNLAALESWTNVRTERLHGGDVTFRPGFDWESWRHLGADHGWESSPFRCVHACFLRRSSKDAGPVPPTGRPNLGETGVYRRGALGPLERMARRVLGRSRGTDRVSSAWKAEKYRRGDRVTVDASPVLSRVPAA